jgi:hypothetical protein
MKNIFTLFIISLISLSAYAEPGASNKVLSSEAANISESRNRLIRLTDFGPVPAKLSMKREDSIVFFVNDTSESLTTLEIDFGDKPTHCGSANLKTGEDGKVRTTKPFGPNDFSSTCFHASGQYPVRIFGLKNKPDGFDSIITVE